MATRIAKAQRLVTSIGRAYDRARRPSPTINPATLTLQQVEAHAASLNVTPESLLLSEPVG